jgi:hypothetical protein
MKNKLLLIFLLGIINIPAYSQFTDITSTVGGINSNTNMGKPQVFDFNNDNYPDFLVPVLTSATSPFTKFWRLYKNNGNSTFSDATNSSGLPTNLSLSTLGFIDYNGDGFKDLYIYTATGLKIFKNNNGTSFTEVTTQLGISNSFFTTGEITASLKVIDFDIDGDEDLLYTRTVAGVNTLTAIVNNGTTFSTKVNILSSIPGATTGGMNFSIFDMDNDGDFDLVFDAYSINSQYSNGIISLFRKDTTGYTNVTNTSGLVNGLPGQISTIDINQDGKLDIVKGGADCCSSPLYRVFIGNGTGVFTEQTSTYAISNGGYKYSPTIADFDNDSDFDFSWSSYTSTSTAPFRLYANNANVFTETAASYGLNFGVTSGGVPIDDYGNGVWLDIDKDGDLDIILNREGVGSTSTTGNVWIKRNPLQGNYINIKLNGCGVNKSGIGSKIKLVIGNTAKYLYYENSTDGNNSNGTDIFHFGLGNATLINSITVYWPNNTTTILNNVGANQFLTIGAGTSGSYAPTGNSNQTLCAGATVANLSVTGTNIQWYAASTGGTALASSTVLANGVTYYASQLVNGCQESARFAVTVRLNNPTVTASATTICRGSSVSIIASDGTNLTPSNNRVAQFSNNVSNTIGISYNPQSIPTNNFTYEFWFNTNRTISLLSEKTGGVSVQAINGQNFAVIPDFYNIPYYRGTGISVGTNGISVIEHSGNFFDARLTHATSLVGWHHCAVVYQNNTFKLYLDGNLIGSRSNGQNFGGYGTQYSNVGLVQTIGKGYPGFDANDNYTGKLDEYRQWSVALNATQINQIFNRKLQSINMAQCNLNLTFDQNTVTNNSTIPSGIILTNTTAPTFASDNSFQIGGFIGNSIYNITNTNINTTSTSTYLWSTGATTTTINVSPNQTTQYWVDVTTNGVTCRKFITITVEWPVVANQSITTCSRSGVGFNFNSGSSSSPAPASYNVIALNLNGLNAMAGNPQVANGLLATDLADDAYLNTNNSPINVVYTVVPVSSIGCLGNPFTITVTVNPEPVVTNQNIITCSNTPVGVNFNPSFSVAAATYSVTAINFNGLNASSGNPQVANGLLATDLANDAYINSTNTPVNVIYTVLPVSAAGCIGNAFTVTVTVKPMVASPTGNSNQTLCAGATVANLTVTGTNIQWYAASTGGSALASSTVLTNGVTYFASQIVNGCESISRLAVTVSLNNPTVTASATTVCSGGSVSITASDGTNLTPSNNRVATFDTSFNKNINLIYSTQPIPSINFSYDFWFNTSRTITLLTENTGGVIFGSNNQNYAVYPGYNSQTPFLRGTGISVGTNGIVIIEHCPFFIGARLTYSANLNGWHHCAVVYQNNSIFLFVDGVLVSTRNNGTNFGGNGTLYNNVGMMQTIGLGYNGRLGSASNDHYTGKLDEYRQWSVALTVPQVTQIFNRKLQSINMAECNLNLTFDQNTVTNNSSTNSSLIIANTTPPLFTSDNSFQIGGFTGTTINSITNTNFTGTSSSTFTWSTGATTATINVTPTQTTQYWVDVTTNGVTCRKFITITVNSTVLAPTGNSNQTLCAGDTVANLAVTGTNIQWYAASTGGTALAPSTVLANGVTYFASQIVNGCESSTRLAVTVSLNNPSVTASATTVCSGTAVTLSANTTENPLTCNLPSNLQNGLVGYWPFCGNANDASGNNNNGTVNGATLTTDRFGNSNSAYSFDGVNNYISTEYSGILGTANRSVSFWAKQSQIFINSLCASCSRNPMISYGSNIMGPSQIGNGFYCEFNIGLTGISFDGNETAASYSTPIPVNDNNWHQYVFVMSSVTNSSSVKIYQDGVLLNQLSYTYISSAIINTLLGNNLEFGRRTFNQQNSSYYNGQLDDIGFWNRALNQQEIAQLYNNSQTTYLWSTGATTATINVTPTQTTQYWVDVTTNGVTCRKYITITIESTTPAPTGNSNQTLCSGATVADLTVTGTNIQWYTANTGGNALVSTAVLANGVTYFASQTVNGCESSTRLAVTVSLNNPTVTASATTVCSGQSTTLTASSGASSTNNFTVGSIGPAGGYVFYDQGSVINGWRYLEASPTDNGSDSGTGCYCVSIPNTSNLVGTGKVNTTNWINAGCNGYWFNLTQSFSINGLTNWFIPSKDELNLMYVNLKQNNLGNFQNVPYWTSSPASYGSCGINGGAWVQNFTNGTQNSEYRSGYQGAGNLRLVRQFASGIPLSTYLWSTGATTATINVTPNQTTEYWVDVTTNGVTCRKYITITVGSATPAPTGANNQTVTQGSTIVNLIVTGQNILWYSTPFGGTPLPENTVLVNGVTYYASQTINGCESEFRLPVIVQITLSNDDFNSTSIVYSPNPVTDILSVRASIELKTAKICNMLGQTVMQQNFDSNEIQLDMSNLPTGSYLVIVESDNRKETFKIIKR